MISINFVFILHIIYSNFIGLILQKKKNSSINFIQLNTMTEIIQDSANPS